MDRRSAKQKGTTAQGPKAADWPSQKWLIFERYCAVLQILVVWVRLAEWLKG
jgi:hypothetical protein